MHRQLSKIPTWAGVILLATLASRVAWHASYTQVGWEVLHTEWVQTAVEIFGMERPELSAQEPDVQARFWLHEIERLDKTKPNAAEAAGAAWILDAPQRGFMQRYVRANPVARGIPGLALGAYLEPDWDAVRHATEKFEELCCGRCLDRIEEAIRLDPANVERWRARALLLFQNDILDIKPRRDDWRAVLDECIQHDPDNALYDYLGAVCEWTTSANYHWEREGYVLDVRDPAGFERGQLRFAAGLAKSAFKCGTTGASDTLAFLAGSSISRTDHVATAESRATDSRAGTLLFALVRWQSAQHNIHQRERDSVAAAATLRQTLRVARQVSASEKPAGFAGDLVLQRWSLANLAEVSDIAPDEAKAINAELRDVRLELEILSRVDERLKAKDRPKRPRAVAVTAVTAVLAQPLAECLLLFGVCCWLFAKLCARRRPVKAVRMGLWRHLAAWVLGFAVSYILFGLCPAGIASAEVQTRVVQGLLNLPLLIAFAILFFLLNRTYRVGVWQMIAVCLSAAVPWVAILLWEVVLDGVVTIVGGVPPLATLFLSAGLIGAGCLIVWTDRRFLNRADITISRKGWLMMLVSVQAGLTIGAGVFLNRYLEEHLETRIWISARVWSQAQAVGLMADDLRAGLHMEQHRWLWSLLQWHAYSGGYVGLTLTLVLLAVWAVCRQRRMAADPWMQILRRGKRAYAGLIGAVVARTLIVPGLIAFAVYLATVPAHIDEREATYQLHYMRLVDPAAARREFDSEVAAVRNDAALMAELRQIAEK